MALLVIAVVVTGILVAVSAVSAVPARALEGPAVRSTEAEALAAAEQSGTNVEVAGLRGEARDVYATPDGRMEAVEHVVPVRAWRQGGWVPIDTGLRRQPDGGVAPVASTVGLVFSGGGNGALVRMSRGGREIMLTWPWSLPAPTISGNTALYGNVLPDVDLLMRAEADGFTQLVVIRTAQAARDSRLTSLRLAMRADGLRLTQDATGYVRAADTGTGGAVFEAPRPLMWDSSQVGGAASADPSASPSPQPQPQLAGGGAADPTDGPLDGAQVSNVAVGMDAGALTLTPDQGLLTGSTTTFPVYVDPFWKTTKSTDSGGAWAMVSNGYPTTTYYKFDGKSSEGVGYCEVAKDGNCVKNQIKRLFYRLPSSFFIGKSISDAYFVAHETAAYDCDNPTTVQLWSATGFGTSSTWNTTSDNWVSHLASRDVAYCSTTPVEFHDSAIVSYVKSKVSAKASAITFGLRAYSESSMAWWKRFNSTAELHVYYNTPPRQAAKSDMKMLSGGNCGTTGLYGSGGVPIADLPSLYVEKLTDPDAAQGDKVAAQFGLSWDDGSGWKEHWVSAKSAYKASGSPFSLDLKTVTQVSIPQRVPIGWHVRANDGDANGPWSWEGGAHDCYFTYDKTVPIKPTITSTDYPGSDPENPDDPWYDGVGKYGTFTISAAGADTVTWTVNDDPAATGTAPVTNGVASVRAMPTRAGPNFLDVVASTRFGNTSTGASYIFRASAGAGPVGHWKLDDSAGTTSLADSADKTGGLPAYPAQTHGGVTLGGVGVVSKAASLDGTSGYASTSGPTIDTSRSFSVSAWARLPLTKPTHAGIIATQIGTTSPGFELYYSSSFDTWIFNRYDADTATATIVRAMSTKDADKAKAGAWTHLVGVFDAENPAGPKLRLYVNGLLAGETAYDPAKVWKATGRMQIGTGSYGGTLNSFFPGNVDDLRVYGRVITKGEIPTLKAVSHVVTGRWRLNSATSGASANDVLVNGLPGAPVTMTGQAGIDTGSSHPPAPTGPSGSLSLNQTGGASDYAATQAVDATRGFTAAAWVRAPARPQRPSTVLSLSGAGGTGLTVRYKPDPVDPVDEGPWEADMVSVDAGATTPTHHYAHYYGFQENSDWDLLTVVYDALTQRLALYVNGNEQDTDDPSYSYNTSGFDGAGGLQFGRNVSGGTSNEYWIGNIDDVWLFDGALDQDEITKLNDAPTELDLSQMT